MRPIQSVNNLKSRTETYLMILYELSMSTNILAEKQEILFSFYTAMKLIHLGLIILLSGVWLFQQNDYKVIFERAEVISHNKIYVNVATAHTYKYNRTQAVVNLTVELKQDLGNEVHIEVQAYKFASNEYRYFPLRFMFNFCDYVAKNEFGLGELFHCANITACPLKRRVYNMCMWKPNGGKFPPHVPKGNYMLDLKFFYHDFEFLFLQLYCQVKYPEVKGYF